MKILGIDVSEHQGSIDWQKVKAGGIKYAILRVGYGDDSKSQDDKYFIRNANECTRLGIPFGVYIYSYAVTMEQVHSEARHTLRLIKGYKLSYPVYYDLEDSIQSSLSPDTLAKFADAYCKDIEAQGYLAGVYANLYWWNNKLTSSIFDNYEKWVAQYKSGDRSDYGKEHGMWQYTSSGRVSGIIGNTDMNYCYKDYPRMIGSEYDLEKIVVYYGDVDSYSAIMVSQKNRCPLIKMSDFETSGLKVKNIIQVGGKKSDTDRFVTFKNASELL